MSAASTFFPQFTTNTWSASHAKRAEVFVLLPLSLRRLISLLSEGGEDDHGQIGPSQFAFKNAFMLVADAISILGDDVPSSPVVDSQGGIRITWRNGNKHVKLICPAERDAAVYIYQASGDGNSLRNQNVTAAVLADRLSWLTNRESAAAG